MNKNRKRITTTMVTLLAASLFVFTQAIADEVAIVGKVNDNYQIVSDDGTVYEIADNDMGNELLEHHTGKNVQVIGKIVKMPDSEDKIVNVISYTVLDK